MRFALIVSGRVVNCVEADPRDIKAIADAAGAVAVETDIGSVGDQWDDEAFHRSSGDAAPDLALQIEAGSPWVSVGTAFPIRATLRLPGGDLAPVDELFLVPIERSDAPGRAAMVKGVQFSGGQATVQISFPASGYYQITESGINSRLTGRRIGLSSPFEITVYD